MKKIVILLFVSIFNFGKSQYVGVNNQNPNVALDVKGDLRVRSLETASSFSLSDNFVLSDTNNKLKTVKKFNYQNLLTKLYRLIMISIQLMLRDGLKCLYNVLLKSKTD